MEYYSTRKRNETLIHSITWMNVKIIMLSERSWSWQTSYYMILFKWNVYNRQIHKGRVIHGCQGLGLGKMTVNSMEFLGGDENVIKLVMMVAQLCEYTKNHWIVHLKRVNFYGIWIIYNLNIYVHIYTHTSIYAETYKGIIVIPLFSVSLSLKWEF